MKQPRMFLSPSVRATVVALSCVAIGSYALVGCGKGASESEAAHEATESSGDVSLELQLAGGATLTSVKYAIVGPLSYSKTGSIDVSNSTKISATISGIPTGKEYAITLTASTADASVTCGGSATFDVAAHQTSLVTVAVTCKETATTGSVLVSGALNVCPVIDGVDVVPSDLTVGGSVVVKSQAHDTDSAPAALSYKWTVSSGTLSSATAQNPTFTCTAAGSATLTLAVSDGDTSPTCGDSLTATVNCSTPPDTAVRAQIMQDCPYAGWNVSLPVGDYTRTKLVARGFVNDDLSSVRVAPGYEVVLYSDDNFGGPSVTLDKHTECTTSVNFNDKATSLRVRRKADAPVGPAPKMPPGEVNTTFFVISDTHADAPGNESSTHESNLLATARAVNKVAADGAWPTVIGGQLTGFSARPIGTPEAGVVFSGDLIGFSQGPSEYPTFEKYFFQGPTDESIKYRAYVGLGNHDMDDPPGAANNGANRAYAWNWLDAHHKGSSARVPVTAFDAASHSYSWDQGGVHFVHSNRAPGDTNAGLPSNIPFLEQDLATRAADGRPVFVFHHFGFDAFGTQDRWWTAAQRTTYGNTIAPYNMAALVAGHSHYAYDLFMFDEDTRSDNRVIMVNNAKAEINAGNNDGNGSFAIIRITNDELWMVTCRWLNTAGEYEMIAPFYRGPAVLLK